MWQESRGRIRAKSSQCLPVRRWTVLTQVTQSAAGLVWGLCCFSLTVTALLLHLPGFLFCLPDEIALSP